jgi:hypothetical protein
VDYRNYKLNESHDLSAGKHAAIHWAIEQVEDEDVWND